jgi:hypothetical protein
MSEIRPLLQVRELDARTRVIDTPAPTQLDKASLKEIRDIFVAAAEKTSRPSKSNG